MVRILGIETSCDETAAAVVEDGQRMLSNVIASQIDLHAAYGGVYPEVASRAHVEVIDQVVAQALQDAGMAADELDAIAVTRGPGLIGSLLVGISYAKGLALATDVPLMGINHLEGHVYAPWLAPNPPSGDFPALVLIVSGGHTELLLMRDHGVYERLGGTLDDAAGEAFDKVGRILGLPYPGGPHIEQLGAQGNPGAFRFPRAKRDDSYDFSFSGLKTAVMREVTVQPSGPVGQRARGAEKTASLRADVNLAHVAASFQAAVVDTLVSKTIAAAEACDAREIILSGGVSANQSLRSRLRGESERPVRYPPLALCTDNGAMIAAAACHRYTPGMASELDMSALAQWPLHLPAAGVP
jgi:N6-L-threonylcarbamoyladenine synthase